MTYECPICGEELQTWDFDYNIAERILRCKNCEYESKESNLKEI